MEVAERLREIRYLLIDMDGVLYRGAAPTPGLLEFFALLQDRDIRFRLVTNNSGKSPEEYAAKLGAMGVLVDRGEILTSAGAAVLYLQRHAKPGARIYILGEEALRQAIFAHGERAYVWDDENPEYVVVGIDHGMTYEKLKKASLGIRRGAKFLATNADATLPTEEGELPGAGAIVAALQVATGQNPLVLGKPEPLILELAMESLGAAAKETAIIGDRLTTDIAGGQRVGLTTILMLTGVTEGADLEESDIEPELVFSTLVDLISAWRGV